MNKLGTYRYYLLFFCVCFLVFHAVRWSNGLTLFLLRDPFIYNPRQDPLMWTYIFSGIPQWIVSQRGLALILDLVVVVPCVTALLIYKKKPNWIPVLMRIQLALFVIYILTVFSFQSLSIRKYLGLALVPLAFVSLKKGWFEDATKWLRWYVMFIFSSSAMWKILRGSVFERDQFVNIMRNQHFEHLIHFPDHISTQIGTYFIEHPDIAMGFYCLVTLIQLSFAMGFFTRRYDKYLLVAFLLFILGDYLVMRVEYWEFLVFVPLFYLDITKEDYSSA